MKFAVVGGGVSGLTCAWLLSNAGHEVTLFEAHNTIGMQAHSCDVPIGGGSTVTVDVPFRVFNERHYCNLSEMLTHVGIKWKTCNYAATYASLDTMGVIFRYHNLLIDHLSLPWVSLRHLLSTDGYAITCGFLLWMMHARADLQSGYLSGLTIGEYLSRRQFPSQFSSVVFFPIMSVIMTCDIATMCAYPADIVVAAFTNGRGRGVKRPEGGTPEIVRRLIAPVHRVRVGTRVSNITAGPHPRVFCESTSGSGQDDAGEAFDEVIVATEVLHVQGLFRDPPAGLADVLAGWTCEDSEVVVHTDAALMPADRSQWSPINCFVSPSAARPMATMWLNRLHPDLAYAADVFQTWNPVVQPAASAVLSRSTFTRPVMTPAACDTAERLRGLQGKNNIWFCGSYALYGLPLLENGVVSAMQIAEAFGAVAPWRAGPSVAAGRRTVKMLALFSAAGAALFWTLKTVLPLSA